MDKLCCKSGSALQRTPGVQGASVYTMRSKSTDIATLSLLKGDVHQTEDDDDVKNNEEDENDDNEDDRGFSVNDLPSILCLTSSTDDRVVPMHSFKFIAALQTLFAADKKQKIRKETKYTAREVSSVDIDESSTTPTSTAPTSTRSTSTTPTSTAPKSTTTSPTSTSQTAPYFPLALLRVTEKTGHGMGKGREKSLAELADIFSFIDRTIDLQWQD